nr:restriction endonuclease [Aquibacillus saliphilus]
MTKDEFKELLYHLFAQQGYHVNLTPKSGGADLLLRKGNNVIVVYTMRKSENIDASTIKEVVGATGFYKANKKWIVTNRYYRSDAIVQANTNKVKLINRDDLLLMLKDYHRPGIKKKNKLETVGKIKK